MRHGEMCLSVSGYEYYNGFFPYINLWKTASGAMQCIVDPDGSSGGAGSQTWTADLAPGYDDGTKKSPWGVFLDTTTGELLDPLPTDAGGPILTRLTRIFATAISDFIGESWVVKFDGTCSLVQLPSATNVSRVGNRITWTWADSGDQNIHFYNLDQGSSPTDPPRNIVICPADMESLHDAGEIYRPDYLEQVARMSGVIRGMQAFCPTNDNWATSRYNKYPTESFYRWAGSSDVPQAWSLHGAVNSTIVELHDKTQTPIWVTIPHVLGCMKTGRLGGMTFANPPVITDFGHEYVNGDTVQFAQHDSTFAKRTATVTISNATDLVSSAWTPPIGHGVSFTVSGGSIGNLTSGQPYYIISTDYTANTSFKIAKYRGGPALDLSGTFSGTITMEHRMEGQPFTVANKTATTYELSGFDASSHSTALTGYSYQPPTIANVQTEVELLAAYYRDNITNDVTWWQLSNENWLSSVFSQYRFYYTGMGDIASTVIDGDANRCYGYWAACMMDAIRQTYGDRSRWKGVFAPWTVNPATGTEIIAGINLYISLNAPSLDITDLFDHYAITSYIGSGLMSSANSSDIMDWITTSQTRYDAAQEATKYDYFVRTLCEQLTDSRHIPGFTQTVENISENIWPQHETIATNAGLTMVQYEGGYHVVPNDGMWATLDSGDKALLLEFFTVAAHREETNALLEEMRQRWVNDIGGTYPCHFVDYNVVSHLGAFGACHSQYDTDNPIANGVKKFNGLKVVARPT